MDFQFKEQNFPTRELVKHDRAYDRFMLAGIFTLVLLPYVATFCNYYDFAEFYMPLGAFCFWKAYKEKQKYETSCQQREKQTALAKLHLQRAFAFFNDEHDLSGSIVELDKVLELDSGSFWALALRGQTYKIMGQYSKAIEDFSTIIQDDTKNPYAYLLRGDVHFEAQDFKLALQDYKKAKRIFGKVDNHTPHRIERVATAKSLATAKRQK